MSAEEARRANDVSRRKRLGLLTDSWGRVFATPLAPPATTPAPDKRMRLDRVRREFMFMQMRPGRGLFFLPRVFPVSLGLCTWGVVLGDSGIADRQIGGQCG